MPNGIGTVGGMDIGGSWLNRRHDRLSRWTDLGRMGHAVFRRVGQLVAVGVDGQHHG